MNHGSGILIRKQKAYHGPKHCRLNLNIFFTIPAKMPSSRFFPAIPKRRIPLRAITESPSPVWRCATTLNRSTVGADGADCFSPDIFPAMICRTSCFLFTAMFLRFSAVSTFPVLMPSGVRFIRIPRKQTFLNMWFPQQDAPESIVS